MRDAFGRPGVKKNDNIMEAAAPDLALQPGFVGTIPHKNQNNIWMVLPENLHRVEAMSLPVALLSLAGLFLAVRRNRQLWLWVLPPLGIMTLTILPVRFVLYRFVMIVAYSKRCVQCWNWKLEPSGAVRRGGLIQTPDGQPLQERMSER